MSNRLAQVWSAAVLTASLTGCGSAPTRLYTPYAVAPTLAVASYPGPPIRIDGVRFPPDLDRIEVVSQVAPGELKINDLEHWSAPLGAIARQALSADLVARLPPGKAIYPRLAKPADALGITVDILDFVVDSRGARLQASWVVSSPHAPSRPAVTASLGTPPHPGTAAPAGAATAAALSDLLAQLADRIVAGL